MKKIGLIILMCFVSTHFINGQNKKIFVSRQGGTKKLLTLGKIGYNVYHFTNISDKCDTLICSGSGFEICKIDKDISRMNKDEESKYIAFNKAIRATEKHIKKSKSSQGNFMLMVDRHELSIKYYNADSKGNADIEIIIL